MHTTPRLPLVLAVVLAVLVGACGSADRPQLTDAGPVPTPTPTPTAPADGDGADPEPTATPPSADPTPTPTEAPEPDDGDDGTVDDPGTGGAPVLVAVFTTGGFVPIEVALADFPELVVMADGTVYREGAQVAIFPPPLLPAVERLTLDPAALEQVQRVLAESSALEPGTDFGEPPVADAATTTVTSFLGGEEVSVSAYALGFDDLVSPEALAARRSLESAIADIQAIVDAAAAGATITRPPALAVLTFPSLASEEDQPVREWPIDPTPRPQPSGGGCVVIRGGDVDTIWDAAADATIQTLWDIEGTPQPVVLRPVFAHESVC